ncbi:hypothetical protein NDU88_002971 [Pleurodeles waltl]|uniref:Uncharacterized protein n=1 Tax=Pleurodeles waltl TaxID=8319 RepID=A0AAV7SEP3_PLEWA|nr:hypothetical protein NDU88_002971 [Pleurodeles waltl]
MPSRVSVSQCVAAHSSASKAAAYYSLGAPLPPHLCVSAWGHLAWRLWPAPAGAPRRLERFCRNCGCQWPKQACWRGPCGPLVAAQTLSPGAAEPHVRHGRRTENTWPKQGERPITKERVAAP